MTRKILLTFLPLCFAPTIRAEILRSNNNAVLLNTAAAWQTTVPAATDVIAFDSTGVPAAATATTVVAGNAMGGDLSVLGIRVANNVGGTINTTNYIGIHNNGGAAPFQLSIGASGIDMSVANQALRIQAKVNLTDHQTWAVTEGNTSNNVMGFNNGEDLSFDGTSAAQLFEMNGKTVTVNGTGRTTITSGYTVNNGTFNVNNTFFEVQSGGSRNTLVNSNVTFNVAAGSILHFQSNSAAAGAGANAMFSNGTVNLNGGTLQLSPNNAAFGVTLAGPVNILAASTIRANPTYTNGANTGPVQITGNISGSAPLSLQNGFGGVNGGATVLNNQLRLGGDNSGYTGTVTIEPATNVGSTPLTIFQAVAPTTKPVRLMSSTAGSAAATWVVSNPLEVDGVSVQLGTLNGASTITNSSATTPATLNVGAGTYSGVISNGATQSTSLNKLGSGTLSLTGTNTYTGATNVSGGVLDIPGSITSNVSATAGLVQGHGTVTGSITTTGATLSPGNGITRGDLTVTGSVSLDSTSTLKITIDSELALDQLANTGTFNSSGSLLNVTFNDLTFTTGTTSANLAAATRYPIITGSVDPGFTFSNATAISPTDLATLGLSGPQYEATFAGQRFWLERGSLALVPIAPVPELSSGLLMMLAGGLMFGRRRRK